MSGARRAVGSAVMVGLAACFVAGVLWIVRARTTADASVGTGDAPASETARERPRVPELPAPPVRERDESSRTFDGDDGRNEPAGEERACPIDGAVILLDADGKERVDADGEMVTLEDNRYGAPPQSVPITKGRFHVEIREGHRLHIHGIRLDGHLARPDREDIRSRVRPRVTLFARASRACLIHCVDAVTGAELTGVTIVEDDLDQVREVTPDQACVHGASSPIQFDAKPDLDRVPWSMRLRVLVPGYAACYLDADFRFGGEVFLPMSRAAALRVTVKDAPERGRLRVVRREELPHQARMSALRESGADVESERGVIRMASVDSPDPIFFPSIPSGDYDVSIVPDDASLTPTPLVHGLVTLEPEKTEEITLVCPEWRADPPVSISGTVEVPRAWGNLPFRLVVFRTNCYPRRDNFSVVPSEAMTREDGDPRIHHWTVNGLRPTTYAYFINELGCGGEWTIGPEGRSDLRIVVKPCARVIVHLIDVATARPVDWYCVEWSPEGAIGRASMRLLGNGDDPIAFEGRLPTGTGTLVDLNGMQIVEPEPIEIHPGSNDITRSVHPLPGIRLELRCEEWHVPWPVGEHCRVTAVGHDGKVVDERTDADDVRDLLVSEPGRYRISIPAVYGFDHAADLDIEIPEGRPALCRLELKHKQ